jgi:hypothetical protein
MAYTTGQLCISWVGGTERYNISAISSFHKALKKRGEVSIKNQRLCGGKRVASGAVIKKQTKAIIDSKHLQNIKRYL